MVANPTILILAGDGIGPEVMTQVKRVIHWFDEKRGLHFDVTEDLVGGAAYDVHGTPLTDETMTKAHAADAVLISRSSQSAAFCVCAKKWICFQTCALPNVLTLWPTSQA
jgi:isocitrate/isopropylmalate dehydrogenase